MKKDKVKGIFLANLEKVPLVTFACEKTNISRNSVYRWRREDIDFCRQMEKARRRGVEIINDITENQLFQLIKEKNYPAIRFWLNHRHPDYMKDKKLEEAHRRIERLEKTEAEINTASSAMEIVMLMHDLGIWKHEEGPHHKLTEDEKEKRHLERKRKFLKLKKLFKLLYKDKDSQNALDY